jgi:hypothetical protein
VIESLAERAPARAADAGATSTRPQPVAALLRDSGTPADTIVELLREMLEELRALPGAIAAALHTTAPAPRSPLPPLRDGEQETLVAFARDVSTSIGDVVFAAHELVAHARFDPALAEALNRAGCGSDSRKIGKRLQRSEGRALQGYTVERVKTERGSAVWRIIRFARVSLPLNSYRQT